MVNSFETNWDLQDYDNIDSWIIALSLCPSFSLFAQWIRGLCLVSSNVAFLNVPPNNGDDKDEDTGTAVPPEKGKQHEAEPAAPTKDVASALLLCDQGLVANTPEASTYFFFFSHSIIFSVNDALRPTSPVLDARTFHLVDAAHAVHR